jgi:membrane-associated protein
VTSELLDRFADYGYLAVFLPVLLELLGVPFPAETILLAAGATAATGRLTLGWVMLTAFAAAVIGAAGGYAIGRYGGERLVRRGWPKQRHLDAIERFFARRGGRALLVARFVPWVRIFAPWLAGASRMPLADFLRWNLIGALAWSVAITLAGYFLGASLGAIERALGPGAALAALLAIAALVLARHLRSRAASS